MKHFSTFFISIILFMILFCFISIISFYYTDTYTFSNSIVNNNYFFSNSEFFWPTPGYHTITSPFGKRISPTTGASSNHSGIDIAAPEGSSIFSVLSGEVIFTGFNGANGHTIKIQSNDIIIQYSHLDSPYLLGIR